MTSVDPQLAAAALVGSPLPTIVLDAARHLSWLNPAAEQLAGRPADETIGRHVTSLFPPEDAEATLAALEAAARGELGHLEFELVAAGGIRVPVGMTWSPVVAEDGTDGLVGIGRDITHRKALEHELATMADSFRALASGTDLAMYRFQFRPELRVDYVNPHFEAVFGVFLEQLAEDPQPLTERLDLGARTKLDAARRGAPVVWPIEARWQHPDGHTVDLQLHEVPLRDVHGRLEWAIGIARDVTDQHEQQRALASALDLERSAADRLRRVDQLRQVFLQAVSHELRTPLTAILGFGATLRDRADDMAAAHVSELADRIHRQGERMQHLLDDLLDVDRLSRGVLTLERTETDLAEVVRELCEERNDPHCELEVSSCPLWLDRGKVERIVDNLLDNARRHAGSTARVRVTVAPGDPARLVVEDDGPGVPRELWKSIFEPFEQGVGATGSPSPGTGIGLTLVAAFAALHGGWASVEASDLGGARFDVVFPTAEPANSSDRR
ncbi:MAG: PAS domain-containing sensor histidine kinase [Nitriliruptor sp.]